MNITLTYQLPSLELESVIRAVEFSTGSQVRVVQQFDPASHSTIADVAVCVGPVGICPLAKKKVLFVLGQTKNHLLEGWDAVVVTSQKARSLSFGRFGYNHRVFIARPPTLGLHLGRRRLVDPKEGFLHLSEDGVALTSEVEFMRVWGSCSVARDGETLFNALEFNSRVKAGAIGLYPEEMEDGYDLQVARHLALGGVVVCQKDEEVLGELAGYCFEMEEDIIPVRVSLKESLLATQDGYNKIISEVFCKIN